MRTGTGWNSPTTGDLQVVTRQVIFQVGGYKDHSNRPHSDLVGTTEHTVSVRIDRSLVLYARSTTKVTSGRRVSITRSVQS